MDCPGSRVTKRYRSALAGLRRNLLRTTGLWRGPFFVDGSDYWEWTLLTEKRESGPWQVEQLSPSAVELTCAWAAAALES